MWLFALLQGTVSGRRRGTTTRAKGVCVVEGAVDRATVGEVQAQGLDPVDEALGPALAGVAPVPDGCRDGWGCQSGNCNCWAFKYILSPL